MTAVCLEFVLAFENTSVIIGTIGENLDN